MILADKILCLRKQRGWSQEDVAAQLGVSRQSVSKWESGQALPDLERIVELSELFGITADMLIRDDAVLPEPTSVMAAAAAASGAANGGNGAAGGSVLPTRRVSGDEAREFVALKRKAAVQVATGVFMCIVSPLALLLLVARVAENADHGASDVLAPAVGIPVLLVIVAAAVGIMVMATLPLKRFTFLEKDNIMLDPTTQAALKAEYGEFHPSYVRDLVIGISLAILSAVPTVVASLLAARNQSSWPIYGVCVTLLIVAVGVFLLVRTSTINGAFTQLLQEGDYTTSEKADAARFGPIRVMYWLVVIAGYLVYSLGWKAWGTSWIIWPIAAVLFIVLNTGLGMISKRQN